MDPNDLKRELDTITKKAKEVDIPLIQAVNLYHGDLPTVLWAEQVDKWNKFFDFAKRNQVEFATISSTYSTVEQAEELQGLSVGFIDQGVIHLLVLEADEPDLEESESDENIEDARPIRGREISEEAVKVLTNTTEDELADEILEHFTNRFGHLEGSYQRWSRSIDILFQEKDVENIYLLPSMLRYKVEAAKELAREKFEEERFNREREIIPQVVSECAGWAEEKGLRRLTRANLEYFLLEKNHQFSKNMVNMVYNEVNINLK